MVVPMDIDPVDGGPRPASVPIPAYPVVTAPVVAPVTNADEATAAIEKLRSDDDAQRVAASHQLDSIARILGKERTKNVRTIQTIAYLLLYISSLTIISAGTVALYFGGSGRRR